MKVELQKSIEARKLNKRTGRPTDWIWVTIPFGAFLENPTPNGDMVEFWYLGEFYHCKHSDVAQFLNEEAPTSGEPNTGVSKNSKESAPPVPSLKWEKLRSSHGEVLRTPILGGWLVAWNNTSLTFLPDAKHLWDGVSSDLETEPDQASQ